MSHLRVVALGDLVSWTSGGGCVTGRYTYRYSIGSTYALCRIYVMHCLVCMRIHIYDMWYMVPTTCIPVICM